MPNAYLLEPEGRLALAAVTGDTAAALTALEEMAMTSARWAGILRNVRLTINPPAPLPQLDQPDVITAAYQVAARQEVAA